MSRPRKVIRSSGPQPVDPLKLAGPSEKRTFPNQKLDLNEFLREYRRHEVLWNTSIPAYSQQSVRQEALLAMADKFGLDAEATKRKIHTTRSTYNQLRVKMLEAVALGRVYQPTLSWYSQASFLDPFITLRKNRESLSAASGVSSVTHTNDLEEFTKDLQSPRAKRIRNADNPPVTHNTTTSIRVKVKPDTGELLMEEEEQPQQERRRPQNKRQTHHQTQEEYHHQVEEEEDEMQQQEEEEEAEEDEYVDQGYEIDFVQQHDSATISATVQPESSGVEEKGSTRTHVRQKADPVVVVLKDEISLFTDLMENQLRAMPIADRLQTMGQIQSLITQVRLQAMKKEPSG